MLSININPTIDLIINKAKKRAGLKDYEEDKVRKAYCFANKWHEGQKRVSGDEYMVHPLAVSYYLAELKMDADTIIAGLLHDVPEDTKCTQEEIEKEFGKEVAQIIEGVTRLSGVKYFGKKGKVEDLRRLLLIMAKDLRVIVVKLADRLHNMQTIDFLSEEKRKNISAETIEIFAPLASRLGMGEVKGILEDLSFKYYLPEEYDKTNLLVGEKINEQKKYIKKVIIDVERKLKDYSIKGTVEGRVKHLFSFYRKLNKYNGDISKIYDLIAIRIIVNTVSDCYKILGIIHKNWKPLPQRIKDYISLSKPNGYQSLHTTVFCLDGKIIEIQIKTKKMHEEAEWGVAAHWHYEQNKKSNEIPEKLSWITQLIEWQKDLESSAFMDRLKIDVFKDRIFVFTPKGEVIDLPEEVTPIDFAYVIHTEIGNSCIGCKVNNKIVPLSTYLNNGDLVEILTAKNNIGPSRDWLRFVKTPVAINNIRRWFKEENKEEYISLGKELLNAELKTIGKSVDKIYQKDIKRLLDKYPYNNLDGVLSAIGSGILNPKQIASFLYLSEEQPSINTKKSIFSKFLPFWKKKKIRSKVIVDGDIIDNLLISFASCCKPDIKHDIIGFITRGRGIMIHRKDCPNIRKEDKGRLINVHWTSKEFYSISLLIEFDNSTNILKDLTALLDKLKIETKKINLTKNNNISKITANLIISNNGQLNEILENISNLPAVKLVKKL